MIVPTLRVGMQLGTLCVPQRAERRASVEAFPRRAWERSQSAAPALKSPAIIRAMTIMKAPRMTKTHGSLRAQKLVELGWTVKHEFKADNETYEWYLEWEHVEEPPLLSPQDDWGNSETHGPRD
ncbi:hypothetical protein EMIT043CA1_80082 [Pseudomonas brassicacearum]